MVQELSSNVVVIEKLDNFQYKDKNGKDFGENVRHRAKQLAELIIDPDRIREERRKVWDAAAHSVGSDPDMHLCTFFLLWPSASRHTACACVC